MATTPSFLDPPVKLKELLVRKVETPIDENGMKGTRFTVEKISVLKENVVITQFEADAVNKGKMEFPSNLEFSLLVGEDENLEPFTFTRLDQAAAGPPRDKKHIERSRISIYRKNFY